MDTTRDTAINPAFALPYGEHTMAEFAAKYSGWKAEDIYADLSKQAKPTPHWSGGNTTTAVALWEGFMWVDGKHVGLGDVGVDYMGGYVGAYACMAWWADCIDWVLTEVDPEKNFPGVFEYEVAEEFGTWLRSYINKPTDEPHTHTVAAFDGLSRAHLASLMAKFFGVEQDTGDPDDMSQGEYLLRFSAKLQEWAEAYPGNRHW